MSTIGTGETHTTIDSWEQATDIDLVTAQDNEVGELKAENFAETVIIRTTVGFTNATYYRCLLAQSGAEFDHTEGTSSKARLDHSRATPTSQIEMREDYFRLGWDTTGIVRSIGVRVVTSTTSSMSFVSWSDRDYMVAKGVVIYESSSDGDIIGFAGGNQIGSECVGCLVYDLTSNEVVSPRAYGYIQVLNIINCVAYNITGTERGYGFYLIPNCYNCAAAACSTSAFVSITSGNYCLEDDGTAPGANSQQNQIPSDCWVNISAASEDFHVKDAASALVDNGNDAYGVEFDIDGVVIGDRNDIGIDEYSISEIIASGNLHLHGHLMFASSWHPNTWENRL